MKLTLNFNQISKSDTPIAGGKGASLGEMTQAGMLVPPGFVVLSAGFEKFLEETDLNVEIDSILHTVNIKEMHTIENASEKIKDLILKAKMPKDISQEIKKEFKNLNAEFVAVRSSATAEDSSSAAWAGQLDSFLNTTEETLLANVQRCWASLFTPRAIFYRFEKGLHNSKISVAVVIQKMIESEVSGIAFSVHPVTQDHNQLIIEAGYGLGEAIVSGQITPDSYVIEKNPRRIIIDKNVSVQERGIYRKQNGGNEWHSLPEEKGQQQKLTDEQILELSELIIKIENHYGFPCDIEWAYENNEFYITQSRPITTLGENKLNKKNNKIIKWRSISSRGRNLAVFIIDSMIHAISEKHDQLIYGIDLSFNNYRQIDKNREISEDDYQHVVEKLMCLAKNEPFVIKKIPTISLKFIEELKSKLRKWNNEKIFNNENEWARVIEDFFISLSKIWAGAPGYSYIFLGEHIIPVFIDEVIKFNKNKIDKEDALQLIQPKENTEMTKLAKKLESIAFSSHKKDFKIKIKNLARQYGYLGRYYFWGNGYKEKDLYEWITKIKKKKNDKKEKPAKTRKIKLTPKMKVLCVGFQKYALMSNRADEITNKAIEILQPVWKGIANKFQIDYEHVANMRESELLQSLKENKLIIPKEELVRRTEDHLFWYNQGNIILDTEGIYRKEIELKKEFISEDVKSLTGQNASVVKNIKGLVKIINTPKDISKFKKDEILVTTMTNPEFLLAMQMAKGFITDDGGLLCHAAIVAREMKKPCIIGTKIATKVLHDGDLVEVDADNGVVRILKKVKA